MFGDTRHTNNVATISLLSCDVGHSASFRVVPSIGANRLGRETNLTLRDRREYSDRAVLYHIMLHRNLAACGGMLIPVPVRHQVI